VETELFHADGQTDGQDEANSCFSQLCEKRLETYLGFVSPFLRTRLPRTQNSEDGLPKIPQVPACMSSGSIERHLRYSGKLQTTLLLLFGSAYWHNIIFYVRTTPREPAAYPSVWLPMDKAGSSETFAYFYQTTWRHIPEDSNLQTQLICSN
jgi:hypothetical protein